MTLVSATAEDAAFLFQVYASTRAEELAVVPWPEAQKESFLRMQFEAQDQHYRAHYPSAQYQVIHHEGKPVGRLYVHESDDEIRIMDIALLPAWRGAGLGSAILRDILERATTSGRRVTLHVEHNNRARRLYDRLGFRPLSSDAVYVLMEWRAS